MKKTLTILGLASGVLLVYLSADAKPSSDTGYETATVVSVQKYQVPSNYLGDNPVDAPLQARDYSYDIGVRFECNVYVGRYHSATNYLPSGFAPDKTVEVRLQKHIMYVSLPDHDWDVKMGIVGHRHVKDESCQASG
jgi:hypothetical protein